MEFKKNDRVIFHEKDFLGKIIKTIHGIFTGNYYEDCMIIIPDGSTEKKLEYYYDVELESEQEETQKKIAAREEFLKNHPIEMVKCSCGHTIPKNQVMSASMGTSCSNCYDRMSE